MKSIKEQLKPTPFKETELHKSAGILDDYAVRKDIQTRTITAGAYKIGTQNLDDRYVNTSGDTITGPIIMMGTLTNGAAVTTNATNTFNSLPLINMNLSGVYAQPGGKIYHNITTISNSGASETTLWEKNVTNSISAEGESLRFIFSGTIATSANNKRIQVYFGDSEAPTQIYDSTAQNPLVNTSFVVEGAIIIEVGGDVPIQKTWTRLSTTGGNLFNFCEVQSISIDLTASLIFKITATGGASNEITMHQASITWIPPAPQ